MTSHSRAASLLIDLSPRESLCRVTADKLVSQQPKLPWLLSRRQPGRVRERGEVESTLTVVVQRERLATDAGELLCRPLAHQVSQDDRRAEETCAKVGDAAHGAPELV